MGFLDDAAGGLDHLAGSTDEAFARQFDDEEGGGIVDGTVETAQDVATNDAVEAAAQTTLTPVLGPFAMLAHEENRVVADHMAGSTDESVARQFDADPGGGFADEDTWESAAEDAQNVADDAADFAGDAAEDATDFAGDTLIPDLTLKQKAGLAAIALLALMVIARPYASLADGVAG